MAEIKIFISHSTADATVATKLMDMLQTQFNLRRDNFFLTSDEELEAGGNWIEEIRRGMQNASIVMPLITPSYMESQFCLCELGASWINEQALVPIIIPPLDYNALASTPYRSWMQAIMLNSIEDLSRVAQAMIQKEVGHVNIVRFNKRAVDFFEETITPFIEEMKKRESVTPAGYKELKGERDAYMEAYNEAEEELKKLKRENAALRDMKNAEKVKEFDYAQMSEWETFMDAAKNAERQLNKLSSYTTSIMFHNDKNIGGFIGDSGDIGELKALESQGYILWDEGWVPDYDHPAVRRAEDALMKLSSVIRNVEDVIYERFESEYEDVRLNLSYSPFWEKVLNQTIYHSTR